MAKKKYPVTQEYDVAPHDVNEMNKNYIRHALTSIRMPALDLRDSEAVRDRVMWYFESCAEQDITATVAGLANALGVSRTTLTAWGNATSRKNNPEYQKLAQDGLGVIAELMETLMVTGKINPVAGIFLMKNNLGYTDTTEISLAGQNENRDMSEQALKDRYMTVPEEDPVIDAEIVNEKTED